MANDHEHEWRPIKGSEGLFGCACGMTNIPTGTAVLHKPIDLTDVKRIEQLFADE